MYLRMEHLFLQRAKLETADTQTLEVVATSDPIQGDFGTTGMVRVSSGALRGTVLQARYAPAVGDAPVLQLGQHARLRARLTPLDARSECCYLLRRGVAGTAQVQSFDSPAFAWSPLAQIRRFRAGLLDQLSARIGDADSRALVAAAAYGDTRALRDTVQYENLQRIGLAHVVAVSGSHLSIVVAVVLFVTARFGVTRTWALPILVAATGAYVVLVGASAGALRAWLMLVAAGIAQVAGRRTDLLNGLALAALLMCVAEPLSVVSLSFVLSVLSVAGIVLYVPYVTVWLRCLLPRRVRALEILCSPLALTLVATSVTAPVATTAFGRLSVVAPVANVVIAPLFTPVLVAGVAAALCLPVFPAAADACWRVSAQIAQAIRSLAATLASPRWAAVPVRAAAPAVVVAFVAALGLLWFCWPRPTRKRSRAVGAVLLSVVLVAGCGPRVVQYVHPGAGATDLKQVVFLDVGQGDAMLIRDGNLTALLDAGPSASCLRQRLAEFRVSHIDLLLLTHGHADHAKGADCLDRSFGVSEIVVSDGAQQADFAQKLSQKLQAPVVGAHAGTVIKLNRLWIRVIWPRVAVTDPNANPSCLTTLIQDTTPDAQDAHAADTVLSSGDAERDSVNAALDGVEAAGGDTDVDVLKVPHHGSAVSLDERLLQRTHPDLAVISCGENNRYGHPRPEPLALLRRYVPTVKRTDRDGSVIVDL
jgi:competence protein ComEC